MKIKLKVGKEIPAFKKSGKFCEMNWRDKYCMELRYLILDFIEDSDKDIIKRGEFEIERRWYADQTYIWIKDTTNEFLYLVTWYKDRGKTDMILFQGAPIMLYDLKYLIKRLRGTKK